MSLADRRAPVRGLADRQIKRHNIGNQRAVYSAARSNKYIIFIDP